MVRKRAYPKATQIQKKSKNSIFTNWLRRNYGSKHVVTALLQTGVPWTSGASSGASEHCYTTDVFSFLIWFERLFETIAVHSSHPDTIAARQRSGAERGRSGLTESERTIRDARQRARLDLRYARQLNAQLSQTGLDGLSADDRWYVRELWNGNLRRRVSEAEACHGGRVQAHDFVCSSTLE